MESSYPSITKKLLTIVLRVFA